MERSKKDGFFEEDEKREKEQKWKEKEVQVIDCTFASTLHSFDG